MSSVRPSPCQIDEALDVACRRFAGDVGALSRDLLLREGVLKAAVFRAIRALEQEFDGYEKILSTSLLELGDAVGNRVE